MSGDALALAKKCSEAMWANDRASQGLGIEILDIAPGRATLAMTIRESMTNGQGICHGGFIFALADSAFAFACNGYDQRAVAQHCAVTFLRPAQLGDRLTAQCIERARSGRSGIYDVSVARADGTQIAEFRGHSRTIEGTWIS
ncbi:MAG TPA: hydroxyphenylacetyl-CoA thioesterase PaaI [Hyphomicrobiaceae bacterium]|jgi:acyl-CoA thioesterase|nr:hydroxyphenylacetyl-CoA thioesterase PaaI [Hyphomicrobiaceae bacterium]